MDDLDHIMKLIDEKKLTCEDFDRFILESSEKSVRDRVQRSVRVNPTDSHIDTPTGHQPLVAGTMSIAKRTHPKSKPSGQMAHGAAEAGHKRSTKTQRKNAKKDDKPAVEMLDKE